MRRFERVGGTAQLDAGWLLRDGKSDRVLVSKVAHVEEKLSEDSTQAAVDALGRALAVLAGEIADAVRARRPRHAVVP